MTVRTPIAPAPSPTRGTVHIWAERCKGCQLCIECCPTGVLVLSVESNAKGYRYPTVANDECIACQACAGICPDYAIFATPPRWGIGAVRSLEPVAGRA